MPPQTSLNNTQILPSDSLDSAHATLCRMGMPAIYIDYASTQAQQIEDSLDDAYPQEIILTKKMFNAIIF